MDDAAKTKDFLQELRRRECSDNTIKVYSAIFNKFFKKNRQVTQASISNFIDEGTKYGNKYAIPSLFLIISCFKSFLNHFGRGDEAKALRFPRKDKRSPIALTKQQVKTLLAVRPHKTEALWVRDSLILELFYSTGLRVSELSQLNRSDIDLTEGFLLVRRGKGGKNRLVRLSDRWVGAYRRFAGRDKSNTPVFLNRFGGRLGVKGIQNLVRLASMKSDVLIGQKRFVSPHKLRSTYATHSYEAGEDVFAIQEQLGHESLDTTRRYTKVSKARLRLLKSPLDAL